MILSERRVEKEVSDEILFVATADYHIKREGRIWRTKPRPFGDVEFAIAQLCSLCEEIRPRYLLLAGDIFDTPELFSSCVNLFSRILDLNKEITKLYIQGQHDLSNPNWIEVLTKGREDFIYLHDKILPIDINGKQMTISGHDFPLLGNKANFLPSDILLTHITWAEFFSPKNTFEFKLSDFVDKYKMIISGDIHSHIIKKFNDCLFISPGNLSPSRINEIGCSTAILVDSNFNIEEKFFVTREVHFFKLENEEALINFLDIYNSDSFINSELPGDLQRAILIFDCDKEYRKLLRERFKENYLVFDRMSEKLDRISKTLPAVARGSFENLFLSYFSNTVFSNHAKNIFDLLQEKNISEGRLESFLQKIYSEFEEKNRANASLKS